MCVLANGKIDEFGIADCSDFSKAEYIIVLSYCFVSTDTSQPPHRSKMSETDTAADVCIVGGAGHIGLPLALLLADCGLRVQIQDLNQTSIEQIQSGQLPFQEEGVQPLLDRALEDHMLSFTTKCEGIAGVPVIVVTIGTPVDEFLKPDTQVIKDWADDAIPHLTDDQLIVLRSTVSPGTTNWLARYLASHNRHPKLAFCPERIAQGFAVKELRELPQLISGNSEEAEQQAADLFDRISPEVVRLDPMEAEFAKLFTNSYRYVVFAAVNQFYMLASQQGLDTNRILSACRYKYPRMSAMPDPGFTAGPCLLKDTMQLSAFSNNHFLLGHDAMLVNEGMPAFLCETAKRDMDLSTVTAGILGMAFKAESDDIRDSLSYRLRKLLQLECREVLCSDPYVADSRLVEQSVVIQQSDIIFIATPHKCYRELMIPNSIRVIDIWNCLKRSS